MREDDYISRKALIEHIKAHCGGCDNCGGCDRERRKENENG